MELGLGVVSLVLAATAAAIAFWQGTMSRKQLRLAEGTRDKTETALEEIRELVRENKRISESIKDEIDTRISRILDLRIEKEQRDAEVASRMTEGMMSGVGTFFKKALEQVDKESTSSIDPDQDRDGPTD